MARRFSHALRGAAMLHGLSSVDQGHVFMALMSIRAGAKGFDCRLGMSLDGLVGMRLAGKILITLYPLWRPQWLDTRPDDCR